MARLAILYVGILSLCGAGYLLVTGVRISGPNTTRSNLLIVTPPVHDFGDVPSDRPLIARYEIANNSDAPAEIGTINKGCNCSEASIEPPVISAGGVAELRVVWKVSGKRGRVNESVSLTYTSDGKCGQIGVQVTANVRAAIEPDRDLIEFNATQGTRMACVTLRARDGRDFKLLGVATNHPSLKASIGPGGRVVQATFDPSVSGWESGALYISVVTDVPEEREVRVRVSAGG